MFNIVILFFLKTDYINFAINLAYHRTIVVSYIYDVFEIAFSIKILLNYWLKKVYLSLENGYDHNIIHDLIILVWLHFSA